MLDFVSNIAEVVTAPFRTKPSIIYYPEFSIGLSRDMFIICTILGEYNKTTNVLLDSQLDAVAKIAYSSEEDYVKHVVVPVLVKASEFRTNPVEFVKRHYGSSASARRIVGYYRPIKLKH